MQQDEHQKVATAIVSPSEDRVRMYGYQDSLRHQCADAGQRMAEDSAARDNLQQKTMELIEELHEAETAYVCEQCQARTSQLDGSLTQNAWKTSSCDHIARPRIPDGNSQRDESGRDVLPTAGRQASHISDTEG